MKTKVNVTYIYHSSFLVEFQYCYMLFDYFEGEIPALSAEKPLYIFASHRHYDHYNKNIFELGEDLKKYYIMSKDIRLSIGEEKKNQEVFYIGENEALDLEDFRIQTLKSTDEGVAFLIEHDGFHIYFAGDLNWWHWEGESLQYNQDMKTAFLFEMDKIKDHYFDLAFLPLDPRLGEQFHLGFDYFMRNTNCDMVYPMHCQGDFSVVERLKGLKESIPYREKIIEIP